MSLAQPPGLYRQREQADTERFDSLGTGQGTLRGTAQPWAFPLHIMHLCREKEKIASFCSRVLSEKYVGVLSVLPVVGCGLKLSLPCRFIVTGDVKGQIKFYNGMLQLLTCYSHSKVGSIRSISFCKPRPGPVGASSAGSTSCTACIQPITTR